MINIWFSLSAFSDEQLPSRVIGSVTIGTEVTGLKVTGLKASGSGRVKRPISGHGSRPSTQTHSVITSSLRQQESGHQVTDIHAVTLSTLIRLPFMRGTSFSNIMSTAAEYFIPFISMLLLSAIRFCKIFGTTLSVINVSLRLVEKSTLRSTTTLPGLHISHTPDHINTTINGRNYDDDDNNHHHHNNNKN